MSYQLADMNISDENMRKARELLANVQKQRDAAEQNRDEALAAGGGDAHLFWARIHRDLHMAQGSISGYLEYGA